MPGKTNPTTVGAFVLGAIALLAATVIIVGGGSAFRKRALAVMYFDEAISGLDVGAPVEFDGVRVGSVKSIQMQINRLTGETRIPVIIQIESERFISVNDVEQNEATIEALIQLGLRAQLVSQSMLTGKVKVSLAYHKDSKDSRRGYPCEHPEIPTLPTTLSQLGKKLEALPITEIFEDTHHVVKNLRSIMEDPALRMSISNLNETVAMLNKTSKGLDMHVSNIRNDITNKLDYLVTSFDETLTATTRLISDFDADIDPLIANMTATSEKTAALITSLTLLSDKATALIAPGSPVNAKVISALREISDAMRSFRQLAESLERTPEAIIRGKK